MIAIAAGYEGSKKILSASSYLMAKYLPAAFEVRFLNYGRFDGPLYRGEYASLDDVQRGGAEAWGRYLADYVRSLTFNEFILFGLDDYLLSGPFNEASFAAILNEMTADESIVSGRLCRTLDQGLDVTHLPAGIVEVRAGSAYSVTAQWCIWRRGFLADLLARVGTAWDFEHKGSVLLGAAGRRTIGTVVPAMSYPDESCLSAKWPGVRVRGNPHADVDVLVALGYLERGSFC